MKKQNLIILGVIVLFISMTIFFAIEAKLLTISIIFTSYFEGALYVPELQEGKILGIILYFIFFAFFVQKRKNPVEKYSRKKVYFEYSAPLKEVILYNKKRLQRVNFLATVFSFVFAFILFEHKITLEETYFLFCIFFFILFSFILIPLEIFHGKFKELEEKEKITFYEYASFYTTIMTGGIFGFVFAFGMLSDKYVFPLAFGIISSFFFAPLYGICIAFGKKLRKKC